METPETENCIKVATGAFAIPCNMDYQDDTDGSSPYFMKESARVVGFGLANRNGDGTMYSDNLSLAMMRNSIDLIETEARMYDSGNILRLAFYRSVEDKLFKGIDTSGECTAIVARIAKLGKYVEYGHLGDISCLILNAKENTSSYHVQHKSKNLHKDENFSIILDENESFTIKTSKIELGHENVESGHIVLLITKLACDNLSNDEIGLLVTDFVLKDENHDAKGLAEAIATKAFDKFKEKDIELVSKPQGNKSVKTIQCQDDNITVVAAIIY